jgi:hypothetical protein
MGVVSTFVFRGEVTFFLLFRYSIHRGIKKYSHGGYKLKSGCKHGLFAITSNEK